MTMSRCRLLTVALVATSMLWAVSPAAAAPRTVTSPYTVLDGCDPPVPPEDTSYLQVRNGPNRVELRWADRICTHPQTRPTESPASWPLYYVRFMVDETATGPGVDYLVFVYSPDDGDPQYLVSVQQPDGTETCRNHSYRDLGPSLVGMVHSARFNFSCIGGRQPFRGHLVDYNGDDVPNNHFTPVILPSDP